MTRTNIKNTTALDNQQGGDHYKQMVIQPAKFIHANRIPFLEGNVIKYICRHRDKNGLEDLLKAKHYIDMLIEFENLQPQLTANHQCLNCSSKLSSDDTFCDDVCRCVWHSFNPTI